MHESAIAQSIVRLAEQNARDNGAEEIEEVELEIGTLAGVEPASLDFALTCAIKGTLLDRARIVRHAIPAEGRCGDCETVFPVKTFFPPCPNCGSYCVSILRGKELRIKSIVIK